MNTVGIKATAYCLNFAPELALHYGGTPLQERRSGRDPGFLQALEAQAQTYEQAQAYAPNKTYIGAMSIDELQAAPRPWTEHPCEPARFGKFGEIMPEDELPASCPGSRAGAGTAGTSGKGPSGRGGRGDGGTAPCSAALS